MNELNVAGEFKSLLRFLTVQPPWVAHNALFRKWREGILLLGARTVRLGVEKRKTKRNELAPPSK